MKIDLWRLRNLLLFCFIAYVVTAGGHFSSTDEEDIFTNTMLLSSLILPTANAEQTGEDTDIQRAPQEVGQSLAALPWLWLGQILTQYIPPRWHAYTLRAVMTTFNLFITLCTIWVLHRWVTNLASNKVAIIVAGLYGLASLAWPYSQTFYREPLVALCLLVAFWCGSQFRNYHDQSRLLLSLAAMILAVMTKVTAVIAVPWWLLLFIPSYWLKRKEASQGLLAAGAVMGAVLILIFSSAKILTFQAYVQEIYFDTHQAFPEMLRFGVHGLLTSPGKGLLITAPPILLGIIGFPRFWRDYRREAAAVAGIFVTFVVLYGSRRGWHGGACWGPRYLLPILPLIMLPSLSFIQLKWETAVSRQSQNLYVTIIIACIALLGVGIQLAAVSIFPLNYYDLKLREGFIKPSSLDGGRTYLEDIYFDRVHSPVWGQAKLVIERANQLFRYGAQDSIGVLPSTADHLWRQFITLDTLDFWWLHWVMRPPETVPTDERLGYVLVPTEDAWLDLAVSSGASFNRWQITWRDVEIVPHSYSFAKLDEEFAAMKAAGLEPTVILTYPPDWAVQSDSRVPLGLDLPLDSPQNHWAQFVRATVTHYPEIAYWEIWNEPDLEIYWGGSAQDYFQLLKVAYLVIKEVNPEAQLLMSGFAYWEQPGFAEEVLDWIIADPQAVKHAYYFDISTWHWYLRADDLYERVLWAKKILAERGIEKPIWITETNAFVGDRSRLPQAEANLVVSATEQAAFMVQALVNAQAAGADKLFVFRLDDVPAMGKVGLVTENMVPRPAYVAYQAVAEFLHDAQPANRWSENGITYVSFNEPEGGQVWVIWNETAVSQRLRIPTNQQQLQIGYPNRAVQTHTVVNGAVEVLLPPATAHTAYDARDFYAGGMPLFVFFNTHAEAGTK